MLPDALNDLVHLGAVVFRNLLFLFLGTTASESFLSLAFGEADLAVVSMFFSRRKDFFVLFLFFAVFNKFTCCASSASFAAYSSAILLNAEKLKLETKVFTIEAFSRYIHNFSLDA